MSNVFSSSRTTPNICTTDEWLAAYGLDDGFPDLESGGGTVGGITRLSCRERQVVNLLLEGCENKDIARQLGLAERTVKACFNRLYLRFGVTSGVKRVKLATFLYRSQLYSEATAGNNTQPKAVQPESRVLPLKRGDSPTQRAAKL